MTQQSAPPWSMVKYQEFLAVGPVKVLLTSKTAATDYSVVLASSADWTV